MTSLVWKVKCMAGTFPIYPGSQLETLNLSLLALGVGVRCPKIFACIGSGSEKVMYGIGDFGSTGFAMRRIGWGI
jgi:hypothetical protein